MSSGKRHMARCMMSKAEIKAHISPFDTKAWNERKQNKEVKVKNSLVSASWRKKNTYDSKTA